MITSSSLLSWIQEQNSKDGIYIIQGDTVVDALALNLNSFTIALEGLQRRGELRFSGDGDEYRIAIDKKKQPQISIPVLDAEYQLFLHQLGYSDRVIDKAWKAFIRQDLNPTQESFKKYLQTLFQTSLTKTVIDLLRVPDDWYPNEETMDKLVSHGIPENVIANSLARYVKAGSIEDNCLERSFIGYCLSEWSKNPLNQHGTTLKPMSTEWMPSSKTINELVTEGNEENSVILAAMEYRLYWMEAGGQKPQWDNHFKWFYRAKFPAKYTKDSF